MINVQKIKLEFLKNLQHNMTNQHKMDKYCHCEKYDTRLKTVSCSGVPSPSCNAFWSPTASGTSLAYEWSGLASNFEVSK